MDDDDDKIDANRKEEGVVAEVQMEEGKLHPLMIPSVIEEVIFHVSRGRKEPFEALREDENEAHNFNNILRDLKNCRLVCPTWYEIATKKFRKLGRPLVFGGEDDDGFSEVGISEHPYFTTSVRIVSKENKRKPLSEERIQNFVKDMENSGSLNLKPIFDNFDFQHTFLDKEGNLPLLKSLVSSPHQMIRILKLKFEKGGTYVQRKDWGDLNLPVLEELHFLFEFKYRSDPEAESDPEFVNLLELLLKGAETSLKKLRISFDSDIRAFPKYGDILVKYCPKTVEKLDLDMTLTGDQIEGIIGLNLTLVELCCILRSTEGISTHLVNKLIYQQKDSLVELAVIMDEGTLFGGRMQTPFSKCYKGIVLHVSFFNSGALDFPGFKKLEVLRIQGGSISKFSYREKFPVLKTLILDSTEVGFAKSMLECSVPCETLRTLVFIPASSTPSEQKSLMLRAHRTFPNIKRLQFQGSFNEGKEFLSCVFKDFTHLEELVLNIDIRRQGDSIILDHQTGYLDYVITGISEDECKKLRGMESSCVAAIKESDLVRGPSIINMTKLKKFTIYDDWYHSLLTDVSAILGFLKVESLKEVELHRFKFSSNVLDKMKEKVKFVAIPTEYDEERPNSTLV